MWSLGLDRPIALRNPFARRVRYRDGFPVLPGAFPLVGHWPATITDYYGVLRRADRELGPFFWKRNPSMGVTSWVLVSCRPESFVILKNKETTSTHMQEHVA